MTLVFRHSVPVLLCCFTLWSSSSGTPLSYVVALLISSHQRQYESILHHDDNDHREQSAKVTTTTHHLNEQSRNNFRTVDEWWWLWWYRTSRFDCFHENLWGMECLLGASERSLLQPIFVHHYSHTSWHFLARIDVSLTCYYVLFCCCSW